MTQNVIILADKSIYSTDTNFNEIFRPLGEYVEELSLLYTILKERDIELLLIPANFRGINQGIITRLRTRSPMADIWLINETGYLAEKDIIYDGIINLNAGLEQITKKVNRILHQKLLLRKFGLIGHSEKMKLIAETIERIAPTDISVLIIGPSGSGKELVARAIHNYSSRAEGRFVALNCGALAEGILESELFGHEKGAFTGSVGKRSGLFVQANGGTIFLDEIGETKPDMQVKLLRVLEDGNFNPVGGDKPVHSDARVIAATNRDLSEAIHEGVFREDLYFRLGVVKIILPPLYDRRGDILPLLSHFAGEDGLKGFSDGALDMLRRYDWPGNVRQLRNFLSRIAVLHTGGKITLADVEQFIAEQYTEQKNLPVVTGKTSEEAGHELIYHALISLGNEVKMLRDLIVANLPSRSDFEEESDVADGELKPGGTVKDMERKMIAAVLEETRGNRKEAARKLGMGERTLYRKLKEYDLA